MAPREKICHWEEIDMGKMDRIQKNSQIDVTYCVE